MRVFVSRLDSDLSNAATAAESTEVSRLDCLSNGLVSRALAHGTFIDSPGRQKGPSPWCYVRPRYQKFSALMVWTRSGNIDWQMLMSLHKNAEIFLDSESFDAKEQGEVEKLFPEGQVKLWPKRGETD